MLTVELQNAGGADAAHFLAGAVAEILFHLQGQAAFGGQAAGEGRKLTAQAYICHSFAQCFLDEAEEVLVFFFQLFCGFLLLIGVKAQIIGDTFAWRCRS